MLPKERSSSFNEQTWDNIRQDPEFANAFFEGYVLASLPLQMALLRSLLGISQVEMANQLSVQQTHVSRLEKDGSDHVISAYQKAAKLLHAKLALIPDDAQIILKNKLGSRAPAIHGNPKHALSLLDRIDVAAKKH